MRYCRDYEKDYEDFWKDIIENEDGSLNKDQMMRELSDYLMIMDNCTKAYCLMTNSLISKPNTFFGEVELLFRDKFWDVEFVRDDLRWIFDNITDCEELKSELKDYFNLESE